MRVLAWVLGVFVVAVTAHAQTSGPPSLMLRVNMVNGPQAVLTDMNTGVQTTVQVGDVIQGWTVAAILPNGVELEREDPEQGQWIRAQLPVGPMGVPAPSP